MFYKKYTHNYDGIADARNDVKPSAGKAERKETEYPTSDVNCKEAVRDTKHLAVFIDLPVLRAIKVTGNIDMR